MLEKSFKLDYPELLSKVVLNVDDNEMNQLVIAKIMENAGIKTITSMNGADAVRKLSEGLKPDVILMDLEMPVMNGLQASEFIRKNIDSQIPIIINSGSVSDFERLRLKLLGINDFLDKPYTMKDIFAKLCKNITSVQVS
jgi:CheY-like chemotaxis protein